jgi:hypothetical protein
MWMTKIDGKKMEDISHCFIFFHQFQADFPVLLNEGIIKRIAFDQYEWTKSKTSLAEYFKWVGKDTKNVTGGFWASVEKVFNVGRRKLSHLASGNDNPKKPDEPPVESKDFKKIKEIVEKDREAVRQAQKDRKTFETIKTLIGKTEYQDIEKVRDALKKIKAILT